MSRVRLSANSGWHDDRDVAGRPYADKTAAKAVAHPCAGGPVAGLVLVVRDGLMPAGLEAGLVPLRAGPSLGIVVLGDSSAGQDGCPGCRTYVDQLADELASDDMAVTVTDETWRSNASWGASVLAMQGQLRYVSSASRAVASAEIVIVALGEQDLPADPRRCRTRSCVDRELRLHEQRLAGLLEHISELRHGRSTGLRVVTHPALGRAGHTDVLRQRMAAVQCAAADRFGGMCVNLGVLMRSGELTAADGNTAARMIRLSQHGHDAVARELLRLGVS